MTALTHERYSAEIVQQTRLMRQTVAGTDLSAPVPSCPEWNLGDLLIHVGGAHRWAHAMVRDRATEVLPQDQVSGGRGPGERESAALGDWLEEGAHLLAEELRAAGPQAPVWSWAGEPQAGFWARRMAHETVVHRADAHLAAQRDFTVEPALAADTVEEGLELVSLAQSWGQDGKLAELRQLAGRSILLDAEEVPPGTAGSWLIEFTEEGFGWRRVQRPEATVTLRAPISAVLQVLNRRLPPDSDQVRVLGDSTVLDFWLARTSFG